MGAKVAYCGTWLHFRDWLAHENTTTLIGANFCKKPLLCQACAVRRAGKLTAGYVPKVEALQTENPALIPAMVTLTFKPRPTYEQCYDDLKKCWGKMLSRARKAASGSERHLPIQWNRVAGSVRSIETKRGRGGDWHVHAHIFVLLHRYIDQAELSREWGEITDGSTVVDVRKCHNGIVPGLLEVIKYAVKFGDLTDQQLWEVYQHCAGKRSIDASGILRGVNVGALDEDDTTGLSGEWRDWIASWLFSEQRYNVEAAPALPTRPVPIAERSAPTR